MSDVVEVLVVQISCLLSQCFVFEAQVGGEFFEEFWGIFWFSSPLKLDGDVSAVPQHFEVPIDRRSRHSCSLTELGNGDVFSTRRQLLQQLELFLRALQAESPLGRSRLFLA